MKNETEWKNPQSEDNSQNIWIQRNTKLKTVLFTFVRKAKKAHYKWQDGDSKQS